MSEADFKGFQTLTMMSAANPVKDCVEAGLKKLLVVRMGEAARKTDAEMEEAAFPPALRAELDAQRKREFQIWVDTHKSNEVAAANMGYCLGTFKLPLGDSMSRLSAHCFNNAILFADTKMNKMIGKDKESLKEHFKQGSMPLGEQTNWFVDEVYAAQTEGEELALGRELFSACMQANHKPISK